MTRPQFAKYIPVVLAGLAVIFGISRLAPEIGISMKTVFIALTVTIAIAIAAIGLKRFPSAALTPLKWIFRKVWGLVVPLALVGAIGVTAWLFGGYSTRQSVLSPTVDAVKDWAMGSHTREVVIDDLGEIRLEGIPPGVYTYTVSQGRYFFHVDGKPGDREGNTRGETARDGYTEKLLLKEKEMYSAIVATAPGLDDAWIAPGRKLPVPIEAGGVIILAPNVENSSLRVTVPATVQVTLTPD